MFGLHASLTFSPALSAILHRKDVTGRSKVFFLGRAGSKHEYERTRAADPWQKRNLLHLEWNLRDDTQ
jgi:hypothetical protein